MTIYDQIGQLELLKDQVPGFGTEVIKREVDEWVDRVVGIAGAQLGGVSELRSTAEHAKQALDSANAAMAQLPLDLSSIISRLSNSA